LLLYLIYLGIILGTYTKLSLLGTALPAIAAGAALRWSKSGGPPPLTKIFAFTASLIAPWPLLWILSGQSLSSLLSYFSTESFEIIKGYSSSMQIIDASLEWQPTAYCLTAVFAIYLLKNNIGKHFSSRILIWLPISAVLVISWTVLKAGMVRHDGHVQITAFYLFLLSGIVFAIHQSSLRSRSNVDKSPLLLVPMLIALNLNISLHSPLSKPGSLVDNFKLLIGASVRQYSRDYLSTLRRLKLSELKRKVESLPIPKGASADILPWDISDLTAQGINYRPRPVFQSYSAYTPPLKSLNARFFESISRPDYVVVRAESLDARTPLEMDAPALLKIASNYSFYSRGSRGSLILKAHSMNISVTTRLQWQKELYSEDLRPNSEAHGFSTNWLMISDLKRGSYLSISMEPSLIRSIKSAIFRSPPLYLEMKYTDRKGIKLRLLDKPENIISLNPYVYSNTDLMSFLQVFSSPDKSMNSTQPISVKFRILAPIGYAGVEKIHLVVRSPDRVSLK
jgi:hypothetical protein